MENNNIQTIIDESRKPITLDGGIQLYSIDGAKPVAYVPDGFRSEDLEKFLANPLRKRASATLLDTASFISYLLKHGNKDRTVIYANTNYEKQTASFRAVIDDHGTDALATSWRTHTATFCPEKTVEWKRWHEKNKVAMSQLDFAMFIEENMPDIASGIEGMPTGTDMLTMATQFEATAEKRFKQKLNVQGGGVTLEYVDTADGQTAERMKVFDKFSLGIKVFIGGDPYRVDARLRYRQNGDKLTFHYELIRSDRVFESSVKDEIKKVAEKTEFLIVTGSTSGSTPATD